MHDWLVSCEHGGNRVPMRYKALFADASALLDSHRGFDAGALRLAQVLSRRLDAPLIASRTTRLLVDLNRSMGHPRLFSELTRHLDPREKRRVIERHYRPYRDRVEHVAARAIATKRCVIHISAHSFTPVWEGAARSADVGLLYDPGRERESSLCAAWAASIEAAMPGLRVRRNYPYRGTSDGLVTYLRKKFAARDYLGIEVELNQRLLADRRWPALLEAIAAALAAAPGLRHGSRSPKITRPSRYKSAR